jgi:hypothetical protein
MSKTLGGFLFIKDGIKYDYNFRESIQCLCDFCDEVSVVCIESEDDTVNEVMELQAKNKKLFVEYLPLRFWEAQKGKEKLAYFQNYAAMFLRTDYQFLLQADEILHEKSYDKVRKAMEVGHEGYLVKRLNLWETPFKVLAVPENRQPCSTAVIRLTKRGYNSYDDGENIAAPAVYDFVNEIDIWHYGFVRRKDVMVDKIKNMQCNVFGMANFDQKLVGMEIFDSTKWFSGDDLTNLNIPQPKIMNKWVLDRM